MSRPSLKLDLNGTDMNGLLLSGSLLEHFVTDCVAALSPGALADFEEILAIVDQYVDLEDTSNTYPRYAAQPKYHFLVRDRR